MKKSKLPEVKDVKIKLNPNPHCRDCYGRGWVLVLHPDLVGAYKEVRPCHCVKAIVRDNPNPSLSAEHYVLIPLLRDREKDED